MIRDQDGRVIRVRYVLPQHKAANWVGRGCSRKSTRPGADGVVVLSRFEFLDRLADLVPPPREHRQRDRGIGVLASVAVVNGLDRGDYVGGVIDGGVGWHHGVLGVPVAEPATRSRGSISCQTSTASAGNQADGCNGIDGEAVRVIARRPIGLRAPMDRAPEGGCENPKFRVCRNTTWFCWLAGQDAAHLRGAGTSP